MKKIINQALLVIDLANRRFVARGMDVITLRQEYNKQLDILEEMIKKENTKEKTNDSSKTTS